MWLWTQPAGVISLTWGLRRYRPEQQGDTVFLGTQVTAPPEQFGYQQTDQHLYSLGILMRFYSPAALNLQTAQRS